MEHQAGLHRLASWRIHQSLVTKPLTIERFWPLFGDKKKTADKIKPLTQDEWNQIMKRHNLNN